MSSNLYILTSRSGATRRNGLTDVRSKYDQRSFAGHIIYFGRATHVKSIHLLNVVVKQEILIKTRKTKQARRARRRTWSASGLMANAGRTGNCTADDAL